MAAEKSKTMYNGDWNAWESAMKGPIGKAKALQLIFPAIQGAGEAEEVVPRLSFLQIQGQPVQKRPSKSQKNGMKQIKLASL